MDKSKVQDLFEKNKTFFGLSPDPKWTFFLSVSDVAITFYFYVFLWPLLMIIVQSNSTDRLAHSRSC